VHPQMPLVTGFEIVNQKVSVILIACTAGIGLALWIDGEVSVGW